MMLPILYSFRRCPYAMRARLAIAAAYETVILREVSLKAKPQAMLAISPAATVPVLQLPSGDVLSQSLDIMCWAQGDEWLNPAAQELLRHNDGAFKKALDCYKYAERFPEFSAQHYRAQGEVFLAVIESRLFCHDFLMSSQASPVDWAIFPFVRQFAAVDAAWFEHSQYVATQRWLGHWLASELFDRVMQRYPVWHEGDATIIF